MQVTMMSPRAPRAPGVGVPAGDWRAEPARQGPPQATAAQRRGAAELLPFPLSYDRQASHRVPGQLWRSSRGLVLLTQDDLLRVGDGVYLHLNGKPRPFDVAYERGARRPQDAAGLRALYLALR